MSAAGASMTPPRGVGDQEPDGERTGGGRTRALERGVLLFGVAIVLIAVVVSDGVVATYLAPDGHIAEVGYITALRAVLVLAGAGLVGLALFASRELMANVLLFAAGTAVALAILEGALRAGESYGARVRPRTPVGLRASAFPGLVYENTPGFVEDGQPTFNSLGMRDRERTFDRGRPSVVVLGDSIESWRSVPVEGLYPFVLEAMFNRGQSTPRVQVLNLGVTGYSLHQKVLMLQHRGLEWHPRVVVLGYCLNDPSPGWELLNYFQGERWRGGVRVLELIGGRLRALLHPFGVDFYQALHAREGEPWKGVVEDLAVLARLGREHDFTTVVVIFPLLADTRVAYPWQDVHVRLRQAAAAHGMLVIDLLDSYMKSGFAMVREDSVHPNALGHRIAGELLYALISERRLLAAE